jgi:hypothetical protein
MNKNIEPQKRKESNTEPGSMIIFDLRALTHFQNERPDVQILSDITTARVVLFTFCKGQELKKHSTLSRSSYRPAGIVGSITELHSAAVALIGWTM